MGHHKQNKGKGGVLFCSTGSNKGGQINVSTEHVISTGFPFFSPIYGREVRRVQ